INTARQFVGFPYMWGGTSIKALDCSGFTKTTYYLNGVILERDASQQAKFGDSISLANNFAALQAGDLLFFGSKATKDKKERISHVAIYIGKGEFIHSATSVRINSLLPDAANYYEGSTRLVRARRVITRIDKVEGDGILTIRNHPWYFPKK
ncbi:MAG: C40 family peptidase, partial [Bacteroidales bacterium]|nr:C40 family peptidase [Bacteroidales bacterium]